MVTEHSIWLMPSGDTCHELAQLISTLASEYRGPVFPPHVTLIGKLDEAEPALAAKARQLATRLKPYDLQLGPVDFLDDYYRSLFVHIEETELVVAANQAARQVFGRQTDPRYMPHMSLLYGDFAPELKDRIIAKIGKRMNQRFQATRIYLYSTQGETKTWYCAGEYPLG